jgi:hypothetical protein
MHVIAFSLLFAGFTVEREKATPAVGIAFNDEKSL